MKPKNMRMRIIRFSVILLLLFVVALPKAKEQVRERYEAMQATEFDDAASLSQE